MPLVFYWKEIRGKKLAYDQCELPTYTEGENYTCNRHLSKNWDTSSEDLELKSGHPEDEQYSGFKLQRVSAIAPTLYHGKVLTVGKRNTGEDGVY